MKNESIEQISILRKKFLKIGISSLLIWLVYLYFAHVTRFAFFESMKSVGNTFDWFIENLIPTAETMDSFYDNIREKVMDTLKIAISATMIASIFSLILALMSAKNTRLNPVVEGVAKSITSLLRNIPVVAWGIMLVTAFGQSSAAGYFALLLMTVGTLARPFTEIIENSSKESMEALEACGATYGQKIARSVMPSSIPQMTSWILFTIETNLRSATLVGVITGTGIGALFKYFYDFRRADAMGLTVLIIVLVVAIIEIISNIIRKVVS